jgi:hypothetical protein
VLDPALHPLPAGGGVERVRRFFHASTLRGVDASTSDARGRGRDPVAESRVEPAPWFVLEPFGERLAAVGAFFSREIRLAMFARMQIESRVAVLGRRSRSIPETGAEPSRRAASRARRQLLSLVLLAPLAACASVSFQRDTATSGTFKSTAWSITLIQIDFPKGALMVARENASDSNLANMVVEDVTQIPSWKPLDWLFDLFSIRYASISGTWGFTGQENQSPPPKF